MEIDLLRNRNPDAPPVPLGPFDGRVGAVVRIGAESYFITTNTTYIPPLASVETPHRVYLRSDMRFGTDDPTVCPQPFSSNYCHLMAMPKRESCPDLQVMWWDPTIQDFEAGSAITRGLGKLAHSRLSRFLEPVNAIMRRCHQYKASTSKPPAIFGQLIQCMVMTLERLQTLPSTYDKMVFSVTTLQRSYLELHALLEYMTVFKPRMDSYGLRKSSPIVTPCMGTITHDAQMAQFLFDAGVPFWFLRPTYIFDSENILTIEPVEALWFPLQQDLPKGHVVIYSGDNTDSKIEAMNRAALHVQWYRDPFSRDAAVATSNLTPAAGPSNHGPRTGASHSDATPGTQKAVQRHHPYPRQPARQSTTPQKHNRNKFEVLVAEEMPCVIPAWAAALGSVNTSVLPTEAHPTDKEYLLPEPALLASAELPVRRQRFIHHWRLLRDALLYRISEMEGPLTLTSQEWRDILEGQIAHRQQRNKRMKNSRQLHDIIGATLRACNVDRLHGFPPRLEDIPTYSMAQAKQVIWEVAEINFRFELVSLDWRASGISRMQDSTMCFAGGMLMGMPMEHSKLGLAAPHLKERHRYHVRLATLMLDWRTACGRPAAIARGVKERKEWTQRDMEELEKAVAQYYTGTFYDLFGRAAVIPMRLEHELVSLPALT
ncbi:hypothetical protein C8R44DRAFT_726364 [Mycena epipterygia]|nr:hypothetical protein C8R44DRAFT_726364 [Mycena epipterygia]